MLSVVLLRAAWLRVRSAAPTPRPVAVRGRVHVALLVAAFFYSYVMPPLGLQASCRSHAFSSSGPAPALAPAPAAPPAPAPAPAPSAPAPWPPSPRHRPGQERGACTMFSQLRFHGGSNHLLGLPTGVLQEAFAAASPEANALGGGVVRLEVTNLTWLENAFAQHFSPRSLRRGRAGRNQRPRPGPRAATGASPRRPRPSRADRVRR